MINDDIQSRLLPEPGADKTHSSSRLTTTETNSAVNKTLIQSTVSVIYTLPFALSAYSLHHQIAQQNFTKVIQPILMTLNILGATSILTIGYHLYGTHAYSMMTKKDIEELTSHVTILSNYYKINPTPLAMTHLQKITALSLLTLMTLPLGWTKSVTLGETMGTPCRLMWLLLYSLIDAGPHINHLPFLKQARVIFFNHFTRLQQCCAILLMFGHAAEDIIDLANTESTLLNIPNNCFTLWLIIGMLSEFFSAGIEAVIHSEEAHHHHHHHALTYSDKALRATIIFGQMATAVYNTLTTLRENPMAYHNEYKDFIFIVSLVGYAFIAWETIHHLKHEHEHEHEHGSAEACCTRINADTLFKQLNANQGQREINANCQQSRTGNSANSAV